MDMNLSFSVLTANIISILLIGTLYLANRQKAEYDRGMRLLQQMMITIGIANISDSPSNQPLKPAPQTKPSNQPLKFAPQSKPSKRHPLKNFDYPYYAQHHFSLNFDFILVLSSKYKKVAVFQPRFSRIFASFFKFMHTKVSPAFISIRAFPTYCVYRNPCCSLAVPKIRSMVSFLNW